MLGNPQPAVVWAAVTAPVSANAPAVSTQPAGVKPSRFRKKRHVLGQLSAGHVKVGTRAPDSSEGNPDDRDEGSSERGSNTLARAFIASSEV